MALKFSELTLQEQAVFTEIFLLGDCNITRIRDMLRINAAEYFDTKEYVFLVPKILENLQANGWIFHSDKSYRCTGRVNYAVLRDMSASSCIMQQVKDSLTDVREYRYRSNYNLQEKMPDVYVRCCVIFLLQGDREGIAKCQELNKKLLSDIFYYGRNRSTDVMRGAVRYLSGLSSFCDNFADLPDDQISEVLPDLLLNMVLKGNSLIKFLEYGRTKPISPKQMPLFMTIAFLGNERELLNRLIKQASLEEQWIGDAFLCMLAGEWKAADLQFTHYLNKVQERDSGGDPMYLLLVLLALIPACLAGVSRTRTKQWIDLVRNNSYKSLEAVRAANALSFFHFACLKEVYSRSEPEWQNVSQGFETVLLFAAVMKSPQIIPSPKIVTQGFELGKKLLERKQIILGIYLLNCAGTLMPEEAPLREEIISLTAAHSVTPLLPLQRRKEEWEAVLENLEELVEKKAGTGRASVSGEEKIYWLLEACQRESGHGRKALSLQQIRLFHSARNKSGKLVKGRVVSLKKFKEGEIDSLLSPEELGIKGYVEKEIYTERIGFKALRHMCHLDNVYLNDLEHPVKLVEEKNSILSETNARMETELSLKYDLTDSYCYDHVFAFLNTDENGICRFCLVSNRDYLQGFWRDHCGKDGKIIIPPKGAKRLADTASKISSEIPFSGTLAKEAYRDLPKVKGVVDLHVRILRDNADFLLEFFNAPLPGSDWLVRPGAGAEEKVADRPEGKVLLHRDLAREREACSAMLKQCPALPDSAENTFRYEMEDPVQILQVLAQLKETGIRMDWCSGSPLKITRAMEFSRLSLSGGSAAEWFAIRGELKVSEEKMLTLQEVLNALENKVGNFIPLDDNSYLQLTRDLLKKLELLKISGTVTKDRLNISPAALPLLSTVFDRELPEELQKQISRVKEAFSRKILPPSHLNGELRNYQEEGFRYLARMADCRIGCCLADDMGLGKTIQLLALLLREASKGPALVVSPASLCRNWEREAQRFAPSLHTQILPLNDREKVIRNAGKGDLLLCSYGIVQSESELFQTKQWHVVILDEAQAIKNHTAKRSKSTKNLQAEIRIASTGTPIENHLLELWSIFDFLNPGLLGNSGSFEQKFCSGGMARPELKKLVSPLILRRRKSDVLDDLPPKTEITLPVEFSEEERAMYETLRRKAVQELDGQENSRIAILASLTKLRRFCCDPSLSWEGASDGSKVKRLVEAAEELKTAGHRALIFSQYVDFLSIIRKNFDRAKLSYRYLDGSTLPADRMKAVDAFQNGESDFFLISLKAGGVGLNLTAADYVIIADPWWNPAVEDQAADRVHRIGQQNPVTVYRLIVSDTLEEKILEFHARKKKVSDDILSNAESSGITSQELLALLDSGPAEDSR